MKEIGVGASLYLLTLKAITKVFILLTIINAPVVLLYMSGEGIGKDAPLISYVFNSINMGNLGETQPVCSTVDLANMTG